MIFKELFHGHDTFREEHDTYTVFFNKDFPNDEYYNFITIDKNIDDFDLFEIIQKEHELRPMRIITKTQNSNQLLESLNFELEYYSIYEAKKIKKSKSHSYFITEIFDLKNYQAYRDSYTDTKIESKYLKSKKNHIITLSENDKILASMILHERKDFIEIDDLYVLEDYRKMGIATNLIEFAFSYELPVRTISDQEELFKEFRKIESIVIATKY